MPRRLSVALVAIAACTTLTACAPSTNGHLGVTVDPAGRLAAVVAVCDGKHLGWLTFVDNTSGTKTTFSPKSSPEFGGTLLLSGPVPESTPEGLLDLLDRTHDYTLSGDTADAGSAESNGVLPAVRFHLADLMKEPKLRQGYVFSSDVDGHAAVVPKADFVSAARNDC